jgi:hypothetical protein
LLAFLSLGFDIYHYLGPGQFNDWNFWISNKRHFEYVDFSRAYPLLESAHRNGLSLSMLLNLNNNNLDQTLNVVSCPFEEAGRPEQLGQPGQKAALLVNSNYEPFLKKEFPDSQWTWLSPDLPNDYGGFALGFIPVNPDNEKILERWKKADDIFKKNNDLYLEYTTAQDIDLILKDLYAHYSIFKGDRFLESVFWEKVAFYEEFQNRIPEAMMALKNGAQEGYPSAQFFNELGDLSAFFGKKEEAEVYFKKAIVCPVNRTTAAEKLKQLKAI